MARLELVEACLRQGQQALLVSRLRQRHMVPVARLLDGCGFAALDVFGGTTFEAALRFLAENPFERLRAVREAAPTTPLLAMVAGQCLVGHRHYADDVVDAFIRVAADAGIDVFRCYDPLNDVGKLEQTAQAVRRAGKQAEGVVISEGIDDDEAAGRARVLGEAGFSSLCLFDPTGALGPARARRLVKRLVGETSLPLTLSVCAQTGEAGIAYYAALDDGVDRVDVALSPLAGGASLPATETAIAMTEGTERATGIELGRLSEAVAALEDALALYQEILDPTAHRLDSSALRGLVPAWVAAHAALELRERDAIDRLDDVRGEMARIRRELGNIPLVPPMGESIATQAAYNIVEGDRYATVTEQVRDICLGRFGTPPHPVDARVLERVRGHDTGVAGRPADLLEPELPEARRTLEAEGIAQLSEEVVVCQALFPLESPALLKGAASPERLGDEMPLPRAQQPAPGEEATEAGAAEPSAAGTAEAGEAAEPGQELEIEVDGQVFSVRVLRGGSQRALQPGAAGRPPEAQGGSRQEGDVQAPMPGLITSVAVSAGDRVEEGDVVAVLEAMKTQNEVRSTRRGTVAEVYVEEGAVVAAGDAILRVEG